MKYNLGRLARDARALLTYPVWWIARSSGPDNHLYKKKRVIALARKYECETFIETGTFYGQMVRAARGHFKKILSVELYQPLFELNREAFAGCPDVQVLFGDSSIVLKEMIHQASGRILFWLDGHFSGAGTARGDDVSPILLELDIIAKHERRDHCILIDDARLFGTDGYPTLEATKAKLLAINPQYSLAVDRDCIVAFVREPDRRSVN